MSKTVMQRSQMQMATTYAPDKHFTFEGGTGACRSVPVARLDVHVLPAERNQIREGVLEFVQNWHRRATMRQNPPVVPEQALDDKVFLDREKRPSFEQSKFEYCAPDRMAYVPDPLMLVCRKCGVVHEATLAELAYDEGTFKNVRPCQASENGKHEWRQIDVVFAHWSGRVDPLSPYRKDINTRNGSITQQFPGRCDAAQTCEFKLHKGRSGKFRDWYFYCHCGERRELRQKDENTLKWLLDRYAQEPGETLREINMLPVSYRANSLYYVQSEQMISYDTTRHIDLMAEDRIEELLETLLTLYGYPSSSQDDEAIVQTLQATNQPGSFELALSIQEALNMIKTLEANGKSNASDFLKPKLEQFRQEAQTKGWIDTRPEAPVALRRQAINRANFARKFDPIRLGLEHQALREEQIDAPVSNDAIRPVVDLEAPDVDLQPPGDSDTRRVYLDTIVARKAKLGIIDLKLIRNLKMLQYSFGYSRVSPSPTTEQKGLTMPVRLCAFPRVDKGKRPIYVLRQSNEALYVRLDEARVTRWLSNNGLTSAVENLEDGSLGGRLIELHEDFGRFAEAYSETSGSRERNAPVFVYGLLHTLSHQLIHACSRFSGLDLGSFGERIFPADLSFVIYRNGMTPDLGNLAAMWRNHAQDVLMSLDDPRSMRCGSGTLCDQRGGACPACIMIPEVSCMAANNILSRAFLAGGEAMSWDTNRAPLVGYFS
ncbi:hypothetical protein [Roseibium sp. MMSF_3544]|uniref:hypothetical protein n=1 Tax=unclassified Roseibium TaxID=2629323 RepID=UPI00273F986D|nr:hypothetical protein [Roseibium sp. MMSF_3544]